MLFRSIFAVICALIFPTIHVGRVWVIYWPLPLPNQMALWPNFRSPLLWDVFAVSTYFTVSLLFWYVGLIPDIATMRDRSKTAIRRFVYGIFALGWRGSHRHWVNYEAAYLLLAAMATPLVLSVHSIVSFDFAVSQLPGWHTTIFPPYFVAGAIFSGFGMVLTLMIPLRKWFRLENIIGTKHLENMAKVILVTGSMVGYAYGMEFFIAWYSGNPYEVFAFVNRAFGDYAWAYWIMISCNVITPQLIWFKGIRRSATWLFILSIFVNIGMWFERFVIVVTSLHHDFLPSSWDYFTPTIWDVATLLGSFGLFFTLFCLFVRFLPIVAMAEAKSVMPIANPHYHPPHGHPPHGHPPHGHPPHGGARGARDDDDAAEAEARRAEAVARAKREAEAKAKARLEAEAAAEAEAKAEADAKAEAAAAAAAEAEPQTAEEELPPVKAEQAEQADDDKPKAPTFKPPTAASKASDEEGEGDA